MSDYAAARAKMVDSQLRTEDVTDYRILGAMADVARERFVPEGMRALAYIDEDIPLNHGVLRPIEIVLPTCLLNPKPGLTPETTPAVVGGNVETSQRVVDVLLGALALAGASQGTMNNVVFGDATFGYYETICGGSGATADGAGASAVQVHMTNTRLTDPEILERRYPVRVREFSIRRGSGGAGRHCGGDGKR